MNLLTDNVKKIFFKYLIPSLGSAMVLSIYTMTDAIVIGRGVGSDALGALNIVTPLLCLVIASGILLGVGGSVNFNIQRGLKNDAKASRYFTISLVLLILMTAIYWISYTMWMEPMLRFLGANDILMPYAKEYMRYIQIFLPVTTCSSFLAIFLRADNDPIRAMISTIIGGIVNIALDIILVFPFEMGMGGAALASMIGMTLQCLINASHFLSKKNSLSLIKPKHIAATTIHILSAGLSGFINEIANGFIVLIMNIQILKYCGTSALSIYSVIANCVILFNSLFTGAAQSIQPAISINFGAGNYARIRSLRNMGCLTVFTMGAIFTVSGMLFPVQICNIFLTLNETTASIANKVIRIYFIAFIPMGVNIVASYYLQSTLKSLKSLTISLLRNVILSGLFILILPLFMFTDILWFIIPFVEIIVVIVSILFMKEKS